MVLAIFSQIATVRVDYRRGVVIDARHFYFVDRHHHHHLVFFRQLLHARDCWAIRNTLSQLVPSRLLFGAKIGPIEQFFQPKDLHFFLSGFDDQAFVLGNHFLFDVAERRLFRRPFAVNLNQTAAHITSHWRPPQAVAKSLLRGGEAHKDPSATMTTQSMHYEAKHIKMHDSTSRSSGG